MTDAIEVIDRISLIFYAARALEYAISGAPIDDTAREALLGSAMSLANDLGEFLHDLEMANSSQLNMGGHNEHR